MIESVHEGGCLCGAVRYRTVGRPAAVGHCHCRLCQRAGGAPVITWAVFRRERFAFSKGSPRAYRSSDHAVREFCGDCGTQLTFLDERLPELVDVTVASLDRPERTQPTFEIWTDSRQPWLHLGGELDSWTGPRE